jgi:CRISPR system Cascade subunit CasB
MPAEQSREYVREWSFLERIRAFRETDRGRLAALRRAAGETIGTARNVTWIYSVLLSHGITGDVDQEIYFMVACLFAFDKEALERGMFFKKNLGATMSWLKLQSRVSQNSVDNRFRVLLDSDFDPFGYGGELAYRLRQTVRYTLSQGGMIDWPQLIADLRQWRRSDRRIQKDWAKAFYDPSNQTDEFDKSMETVLAEAAA